MCRSKVEGGQRCAAHLRPAYTKALVDYYNSGISQKVLLKDIIAFATTKSGAVEISAKIHDTYTGTAMANWLREGLYAGIAIGVEEKRAYIKMTREIKTRQKAQGVDTIIKSIKEGRTISSEEANRLIVYGSTQEGIEQLMLIASKAEKKGFHLGNRLNQIIFVGKQTMEEKQRISDACKIECDRQHVGEVEHKQLIEAYHYMLKQHYNYRTISIVDILSLSSIVEPIKAKSLRQTPITFSNGNMGLAPELILNALNGLLANIQQLEVDEFVKEFLIIHPFQDGNGRTAFLLYNLLTHKRGYPVALPDYFGENPNKTNLDIILN